MKEPLAPFFISTLPEWLLSGLRFLFIVPQLNRTSTAPEPRKRPTAVGCNRGLLRFFLMFILTNSKTSLNLDFCLTLNFIVYGKTFIWNYGTREGSGREFSVHHLERKECG